MYDSIDWWCGPFSVSNSCNLVAHPSWLACWNTLLLWSYNRVCRLVEFPRLEGIKWQFQRINIRFLIRYYIYTTYIQYALIYYVCYTQLERDISMYKLLSLPTKRRDWLHYPKHASHVMPSQLAHCNPTNQSTSQSFQYFTNLPRKPSSLCESGPRCAKFIFTPWILHQKATGQWVACNSRKKWFLHWHGVACCFKCTVFIVYVYRHICLFIYVLIDTVHRSDIYEIQQPSKMRNDKEGWQKNKGMLEIC